MVAHMHEVMRAPVYYVKMKHYLKHENKVNEN